MKISRTTLALVIALGLAAALSTSSVSALNWHDVLLNRPSAAHFVRPNVDLVTLSSEGPVPFSALSVWVDKTGVYTISSETDFDPLARRVWSIAS